MVGTSRERGRERKKGMLLALTCQWNHYVLWPVSGILAVSLQLVSLLTLVSVLTLHFNLQLSTAMNKTPGSYH